MTTTNPSMRREGRAMDPKVSPLERGRVRYWERVREEAEKGFANGRYPLIHWFGISTADAEHIALAAYSRSKTGQVMTPLMLLANIEKSLRRTVARSSALLNDACDLANTAGVIRTYRDAGRGG
jgi:hypothetical protein